MDERIRMKYQETEDEKNLRRSGKRKRKKKKSIRQGKKERLSR